MPSSSFIQQDKTLNHHFTEQDFDPSYWQVQGASTALDGGRGASYRIEIDQQTWVLRRYLRGGMMATLFHDRYLWTGLRNTRPWREWLAVQRGLEQQLPIAAVAAIHVRRQGLFYRAAIISRYIENQGTLAAFLGHQALSEEAWAMLGRQIRLMHAAGLNHADLNANNILIDNQMSFHFIDFDKAKIHPQAGGWCERNLERLLRSLNKIRAQQLKLEQPFYFSAEDWSHLQHGYR